MAKISDAWKNYLDYVPAVTPGLKFETDLSGSVTIFMENKGFFNFIAQKIFNKPRISQIHLDEMGNFIFPLINGSRSIYDIGKAVKEHFGDKAEPLYERLIKYLKTMEECGFITLKASEGGKE